LIVVQRQVCSNLAIFITWTRLQT